MNNILYEEDLPGSVWFNKLPKREWSFVRKVRLEVKKRFEKDLLFFEPNKFKSIVVDWVLNEFRKKYQRVSSQEMEKKMKELVYKVSFDKYHVFLVLDQRSIEIVPMGVSTWE